MIFLTGKLVALAIRPDSWLVAGLGLTVILLWRGRMAGARRVATALFLATLGLAVLPVGDLALRPLETRYPAEPPLPAIDGILVLGGAHPGAQVLFTGGSGAVRDVLGPGMPGAEVARRFYAELGLDPARLVLESASRTTAENARLSLALAQPGQTWVLVTSAFHMPRALASFRAAGWSGDLIPWPVDFRGAPLRIGWDLTGQLERLNIAVREYVGLAAYRLLGRG